MPLGNDRGAEISFGIDSHRRGLLCRAAPSCRQVFRVGETPESMTVGAGLRDQHEEYEHGYFHIRLDEAKSWGFSAKFSRKGRSTLVKAARKRA